MPFVAQQMRGTRADQQSRPSYDDGSLGANPSAGYYSSDDLALPPARFTNPNHHDPSTTSLNTNGGGMYSLADNGSYSSQAKLADVPGSPGWNDKETFHDNLHYTDGGAGAVAASQRRAAAANTTSGTGTRRRWWLVGAAVLIAGGAAAGIAIGVSKSKTSTNANGTAAAANGVAGASASASASGTTSAAPAGPTSGGSGSTVTRTNGTTFVYQNALGGTWASTPFDDSARANSYSPPLNQPWNYDTDLIRGVNLGGWLVLEPFISPALYEPFQTAATPAVDEMTLIQNLGANAAAVIEEHYKTFITEDDFAQIAAAGLNWIRLPIAFWAIETIAGEPFIEGVSWNYFLQALTWARKYGLRVNLDLHAVPGSQNGWNHSGRLGQVGFMYGPMGIVNAQRTLNYIRTLTEFISQPQYTNVVPMFSFLNEAQLTQITPAVMHSFYYQAYQVARTASGTGAGKGPFLAFHDGFVGQDRWAGFLAGADRLALDSHPYLAFSGANNDPMTAQVLKPCNAWAAGMNTSTNSFGFSMAGEWSLAITDCGQYVNGVNQGTRYEGTYAGLGDTAFGTCADWTDASTWTPLFKSQMAEFFQASSDALRNNFFWTWRIGASLNGKVANPMWSYQLGLQQGYIPADPRTAVGACNALAAKYNAPPVAAVPAQPLAAWQTGGTGAGTIAAAQIASAGRFPPASIVSGGRVATLPAYAPSGTPMTLPPGPTPTGMPAGMALPNGWVNAADNAGWYAPQAGCVYPDPYVAPGGALPAVCGVHARRTAMPTPTAMPAAHRRSRRA